MFPNYPGPWPVTPPPWGAWDVFVAATACVCAGVTAALILATGLRDDRESDR